MTETLAIQSPPNIELDAFKQSDGVVEANRENSLKLHEFAIQTSSPQAPAGPSEAPVGFWEASVPRKKRSEDPPRRPGTAWYNPARLAMLQQDTTEETASMQHADSILEDEEEIAAALFDMATAPQPSRPANRRKPARVEPKEEEVLTSRKRPRKPNTRMSQTYVLTDDDDALADWDAEDEYLAKRGGRQAPKRGGANSGFHKTDVSRGPVRGQWQGAHSLAPPPHNSVSGPPPRSMPRFKPGPNHIAIVNFIQWHKRNSGMSGVPARMHHLGMPQQGPPPPPRSHPAGGPPLGLRGPPPPPPQHMPQQMQHRYGHPPPASMPRPPPQSFYQQMAPGMHNHGPSLQQMQQLQQMQHQHNMQRPGMPPGMQPGMQPGMPSGPPRPLSSLPPGLQSLASLMEQSAAGRTTPALTDALRQIINQQRAGGQGAPPPQQGQRWGDMSGGRPPPMQPRPPVMPQQQQQQQQQQQHPHGVGLQGASPNVLQALRTFLAANGAKTPPPQQQAPYQQAPHQQQQQQQQAQQASHGARSNEELLQTLRQALLARGGAAAPNGGTSGNFPSLAQGVISAAGPGSLAEALKKMMPSAAGVGAGQPPASGPTTENGAPVRLEAVHSLLQKFAAQIPDFKAAANHAAASNGATNVAMEQQQEAAKAPEQDATERAPEVKHEEGAPTEEQPQGEAPPAVLNEQANTTNDDAAVAAEAAEEPVSANPPA